MKKYNLSIIMKNAWAIRRENNISMSNALKRAWNVEKAHVTENKMFELVRMSGAKVINGQLMVARNTSSDVIAQVKAHKATIAAYLSGECFLRQSQLFDAPVEWVVLKESDNPYVSFPAVEMFRGTAAEVDDWMDSHKNKQCSMEFENGASCQARYVAAHCA